MKYLQISAAILATLLFSGCASTVPSGVIYTDVKVPVSATAANLDLSKMKVGKSSLKTYVGMVAVGDATIETAKKNGGITKVCVVDWKAKSILGFIGEYECTVYGE